MAKSYTIPDNFIEGGKLFGGTVKTRNFIEGATLGILLAGISLLFEVETIQFRIALTIMMAAPGFLLGVFGINNDPLSVFLLLVRNWRKNRKLMLFNGSVRSRKDNIVDRMLEQKTPQEILAEGLNTIRSRNEADKETYIEGINFVFEDDTEYTKYEQDTSKKVGRKIRK